MASASFVCGERRAFRASARYFATFVVIELVLKSAREPKTALENKRHRHLNPYLPTEHRGTIGTFERIPEYIIADFPMVAKLSPRTIGRSPRVDSPLKSTQNFGL